MHRLGRHVAERADLVVSPDVDRVALDLVRDAEINDLEAPPDENKVGRLEIRMNDAVVVDNLNALEHLMRQGQYQRAQRGRAKDATDLQPEEADKVHVEALALLFLE